MTIKSHEKRYLRRFTRHANEASQLILAPDASTCACIETSGTGDRLVIHHPDSSAPVIIGESRYIMDPCFIGDSIAWVDGAEKWTLRCRRWKNGRNKDTVIEVPTIARPRGLEAWHSDACTFLVWEERQGVHTRVRMAKVKPNGTVTQPVDISPDGMNAYDPVVASDNKSLYVAYGVFDEGRYTVYLQVCDLSGVPVQDTIALTDRHDPCFWPSLYPARDGGAWFSYTCFCIPRADKLDQTQPVGYLRHNRYLEQCKFFGQRGLAHVGLWKNGKILHPIGGPGVVERQFFVASGMVFGTEGATHTQVFEDSDSGVHVILRQHADGDPVTFEQADKSLRQHPEFKPKVPRQMHPSLVVASLNGQVWQPPQILVKRAYIDEKPRFVIKPNGEIILPFGEDARLAGWSGGGEWSDTIGEVGLGLLRATLKTTPPEDLRVFVPTRSRSSSLRTPQDLPSEWRHQDDRFFVLGQTHCHSNLSICRREMDRSPHLNYRFMQDVQGARFGLITDHEYNMWHVEMTLLRKLADYYNFPSEFVALHGYEWTGSDLCDCSHHNGPFGHMNVLAFEPLTVEDFHNPSDTKTRGCHPQGLWEAFADRSIITPPHHIVDIKHPYNWSNWDSSHQPAIEIFQDERGSGEQPFAPGVTNCLRQEDAVWAIGALSKGLKFGFIAGGDHSGFALAGLWVRELTRKGLWDGFANRHCYATTGVHAAVHFSCNGQLMGTDGVGKPARFRLAVGTAEPVRKVDVLHNGWQNRVLKGADGPEWSWSCPEADTGDFFFCRIEWENGELAWSSPVWI